MLLIPSLIFLLIWNVSIERRIVLTPCHCSPARSSLCLPKDIFWMCPCKTVPVPCVHEMYVKNALSWDGLHGPWLQNAVQVCGAPIPRHFPVPWPTAHFKTAISFIFQIFTASFETLKRLLFSPKAGRNAQDREVNETAAWGDTCRDGGVCPWCHGDNWRSALPAPSTGSVETKEQILWSFIKDAHFYITYRRMMYLQESVQVTSVLHGEFPKNKHTM